jgi:chromosome segregation ATPase
MDAIRKKMQSLKAETDTLNQVIYNFEEETKNQLARAEQADCDIRDYGKKCSKLEFDFDETNEKLGKVTAAFEEKEAGLEELEADISAFTRRIMLMEEESKKSEQTLADTVIKLAISSKEADGILKKVKTVESKCMNNEVTLEEMDNMLKQTNKMAADNENKLDELSRKLGVQEDELRNAIERAELAESKLNKVEEELQMVGENMKHLEKSSTDALEREERLKEKILQLHQKYKVAEARFEYGEMNITKLNHKIDEIEDEIYREKMKIKKCADEMDDTFDDMMHHY